METTYRILASDGTQLGPVTLPQVQSWINEGRIGPETQLLRSDQREWLQALSFVELQFPSVPALTPTQTEGAVDGEAAADLPALEAGIKSGANWFFWIAGLSLVNSFLILAGSDTGFMLGLGITELVDFAGQDLGARGIVVALLLDLLAAVLLVAFGIYARRKQGWSFLLGMIMYGLDALIFLLTREWLSLGFHAFALLSIFAGFQALRKYQAAARRSGAAPSSP